MGSSRSADHRRRPANPVRATRPPGGKRTGSHSCPRPPRPAPQRRGWRPRVRIRRRGCRRPASAARPSSAGRSWCWTAPVARQRWPAARERAARWHSDPRARRRNRFSATWARSGESVLSPAGRRSCALESGTDGQVGGQTSRGGSRRRKRPICLGPLRPTRARPAPPPAWRPELHSYQPGRAGLTRQVTVPTMVPALARTAPERARRCSQGRRRRSIPYRGPGTHPAS